VSWLVKPHQPRRMTMEIQAQTMSSTSRREPWNKGKLIGQNPPLRPKHLWSIAPSRYAVDRATVRQKKTGRCVRFELMEQRRQAASSRRRVSKPPHVGCGGAD